MRRRRRSPRRRRRRGGAQGGGRRVAKRGREGGGGAPAAAVVPAVNLEFDEAAVVQSGHLAEVEALLEAGREGRPRGNRSQQRDRRHAACTRRR